MSSRPEPEWDEQEQGWMLALQLHEDTRCPGCGGDLAATTAAENEDRFRAALPLQCFRCLAFAQSHKEYEDEPHPHTLHHLVPMRPKG